jgi:mannose-6-phosphate isomerase-like protein (cupin superfamily)
MADSNIDPATFLAWLDAYERLWRTAGTDGLRDLFAPDAAYLQSPYEKPHVGLEAIAAMWEEARNGPDEFFTMERSVVAASADTAVARVLVRYGDPLPHEYTDLWVVRFDSSGRAVHFEEWAYWPDRPFTANARCEPLVVDAALVLTDGYAEWVRSQSLSAGVYRLPAGGVDDQSPHREDEVYVVTRGSASLFVEGVPHPVSRGTVAFVPAWAEHRFIEVGDDLEVVVVFAPPESEGSG